MSLSALTKQDRGNAAFAICEAAALATRTQAPLAALATRLHAFAGGEGETRRLSVAEIEQLRVLSEQVAELASQIALIVDDLPLDPLAATPLEVAEAARTALADGIADDRRAQTVAGFLTADQGFPALAEALTDADAHTCWTARVVDVLAAFRDVDDTRARQAVALAGVPSSARFGELPPERVLELAHTLYQLAAR